MAGWGTRGSCGVSRHEAQRAIPWLAQNESLRRSENCVAAIGTQVVPLVSDTYDIGRTGKEP